MEKHVVYQDGRDFYSNTTGKYLFSYPPPASDYDIVEPEKARRWFLAWAKKQNIEVEFEE
jgi:hypothetical protein